MRLLAVCGCLYVTLLCTTHTVSAFTWCESLADGTKLEACEGERVSLPWTVRLDDGEGVVTHGYYRKLDDKSGAKQDQDGVYINLATGDSRITQGPGYHFHISGARVQDSGQYTLTLRVSKGGQAQNYSSRVFLRVKAGPVSDEESLKAKLERRAVLVTEGPQPRLHIQLACGTLRELGNPPVSVLWRTPAGNIIPSTSYDEGVFYLTLPNPVESGVYSCHIDHQSPVLACVPPKSKIRMNAPVKVDRTDIIFTLLETAIINTDSKLESRGAQLEKKVQELESTLNTSIAVLKSHVDHLSDMKMCPSGWNHASDKCYKFKSTARNFTAAVQECIKSGGKLAEPVNDPENKVVKYMLQQRSASEIWLGGRRVQAGSSEFVWNSTGQALSFTDWHREEPTSTGGDCLRFHLSEGVYGWNNAACSLHLRFVCEKTPLKIDHGTPVS